MEGVMKKKLLSLIVVAAFVLSIAANFNYAFAAGDDGLTGGGSTSGGTNSGFTMGNTQKENPVDQSNVNDPEVTKITSRINSVYNYVAGILVAIGGADRSISLVSNGQMFASLSYKLDGTYALASLNLNGTDVKRIEAAGGLKAYFEALGFPASALQAQPQVYDTSGNPISFTAADSESSQSDVDSLVKEKTGGKYNTYAEYANRPAEDVVWLDKAMQTLQGGINQGISISFGGSGGASLTTIVNGQAQASYAATYGGTPGQLFQTAQYNYVNGFMSSVTSYNFEVKYSNNATAQAYVDARNAWIAQGSGRDEAGYVATLKDGTNDAGYQAYAQGGSLTTYGVSETTTLYNAYGQASSVVDDKGNTITAYKYAVNGSMVNSIDYKTNTTCNYVNNQVAQVLNSAGYLVNNYIYNLNGTINAVQGYNNGTIVNITAFAFNKELCTGNLSDGFVSADQLRTAYAQLTDPKLTNQDDFVNIIKANHITNVNAYSEHMSNTAFMNFILSGSVTGNATGKDSTLANGRDKDTDLAMQIMLKNNNGISAVATGNFVFGKTTDTSYTADGHTFEDNTAVEITLNDGKTKKTYGGDGISAADALKAYMVDTIRVTSKDYSQIQGIKYDDKGNPVVATNSDGSTKKDADGNPVYVYINILDSSGNFITHKEANGDGSVSDKAYGYSDVAISESATKAQSSHGIVMNTKSADAMTVNTSVNSRGACVFTMTGKQVIGSYVKGTPVNMGGFYDPAVVGVVNSFVGANGEEITVKDGKAYTTDKDGNQVEYKGKMYAKVDASGVNVMDGSGFKPADGEEIFVEVSVDQASKLSIGGEAMFMGNVSKSDNGKYTMTIDENYNVQVDGKNYKGFVAGADVQKAKTEVQNESLKAATGDSKYGWMNTNTKQNRDAFGLGSGSYLDDWRTGWNILAGNN